MAGLVAAMVAHLKADGSVAGVVATRVYATDPPRAPTLPYCVVRNHSNNSHEHLLGSAGATTDRVEMESVCNNDADADALREFVRLAVQGVTPASTVQGKLIRGVEYAGGYGHHTHPTRNNNNHEYSKSIDFLIAYDEAVPA